VEFAVLFIAEYGNILFIRFLTGIIFFSGWINLPFKIILISFLFITIRGTFVRLRYDKLINLA